MKKATAILLLCAALLCVLCGCRTKEPSQTQTTLTTAPVQITTQSDTTEKTSAVSADSTSAVSVSSSKTTKNTTEKTKVPSTKEEVIAAYAAVMNAAKKAAPKFTKIEYQELPDDANSRQISKGKSLVNTSLKLAGNFMTSEKKAKSDPMIFEKGNDMQEWPIYECDAGCMLQNTDGIQSAKCEVLANGNYKLTIVLKPENNPEPAPAGAKTAPSVHGAIIGAISKAEIDDAMNSPLVSAVFKNTWYNLRYHDCKAELTYNPKTNRVITLYHTVYCTISGGATTLGSEFRIDKQELINHIHFYDVKY